VLVRCPNCRSTFPAERSGAQDCPICGKPLVVPDFAQAAPGEPEPPRGTPWERRDELGMWAGWSQTLTQALFEPSKLFASARLDRGAAQVGFAVLTGTVFSIVGQLIERALAAATREQTRRALEQLRSRFEFDPQAWNLVQSFQEKMTPAMFVGTLLLAPVVLFAGLYLNALVTHGTGLLLGQAKRGFAATLAACAYAFAPLVLLALPQCGSIVALVWMAILTGIGFKEMHGVGSGGAAATVLVPYVLLCCGCALLTVFGIMMIPRWMAQ
jgi:hypothetical protein